MTRISRSFIVFALTVVMVACGGDGQKPPPGGEVIIPETTKVVDSATRAALTHFDLDSGIMRFSANTPFLQNLRLDDVLVSEPSAAAPYGYLRKVKAIRQEGGEVVLETTQANITDAVTKGGFTVEGDFEVEDVVATVVHLQGVTAEAAPLSDAIAPQVGVGDNYRFRVGFNEVALDVGEGDVKVKLTLQGELFFNAGWGVHLNIEPCFDVPPVCVDSFEAKIGFEEHFKVTFAGEANAKLTKEIKVASYYFKPLVFFIGPVPVVVNPVVEVFIGATGEVKLSFHYGVTQSAHAIVGSRWTPKGGWKDITGFGLKLEGHDQFKLDATMSAKAYARALASLKFYDLAGPALGLVLGAEIDVAIPRNPTWVARGGIEGYLAFVVGLPVLGTLKEYRATLFNESFELARAANQAPKFSNVTSGTTRVDLGRPLYIGPHSGLVRGYFEVMDPEGDPITLTATSAKDGTVTLPQANYVFTTPGTRTWTVTARDPHGASASITLRFEAVNAPPVVYTTVGSNEVPATVEYFISARAYDPNSGDLACDRLAWNVSAPDLVTPSSSAGGCAATVVFGEQGTRTVNVTATDPLGASTSKTLTIYVGPPPPNPAPRITAFAIAAHREPETPACEGNGPRLVPWNCEVPEGGRLIRRNNLGEPERPYYRPPLYLWVQASDPNGDPLTITWFCESEGRQAPINDESFGVKHSCDPTGFAPEVGGTVTVRVEVSDGTTTVNRVRSFEVGPLGPR
jgi:hypothetical protein